MAEASVDPITLEVVTEGLVAIVKEMRATIIRASYSSVIYEFDDFSCAVFTPVGEMAAQSWDHPGHVLPLPWGVQCALDDFGADSGDPLAPGDVILLNDPYRGGTHLNDVTLLYPVFDEAGALMIFPAVRAHWVDVGGWCRAAIPACPPISTRRGCAFRPSKSSSRERSTARQWRC